MVCLRSCDCVSVLLLNRYAAIEPNEFRCWIWEVIGFLEGASTEILKLLWAVKSLVLQFCLELRRDACCYLP